jgi:hypothetical protein
MPECYEEVLRICRVQCSTLGHRLTVAVAAVCLPLILLGSLYLSAASETAKLQNGDGGPALAASINGPGGIAADEALNLFVVERNGFRIRKIDHGTG